MLANSMMMLVVDHQLTSGGVAHRCQCLALFQRGRLIAELVVVAFRLHPVLAVTIEAIGAASQFRTPATLEVNLLWIGYAVATRSVHRTCCTQFKGHNISQLDS